MDKPLDAGVTTEGRVVPDRLHGYGAVVGGVAAGFLLVGIAAYAFGTIRGTPSVDSLLSATECEAQPISIVLGQDAEARMTVSRRTRCQIASGLSIASVEEFNVIDAPKHGTVMQRGRTGVVYQSDGDFRGKDSFTFSMRGKSVDADEASRGETSVVRVYVTVK